jgi:3-oxoacyl-(acyl-carrier-protein) synthase
MIDVVVSGAGACTALGPSLDASWNALVTGRSGIVDAPRFAVPGRPGLCAPADAGPPPLRVAKHAKYVGRATACALRAVADAMAQARLADGRDPFRTALYSATGQTGVDVEEFFPALSVAWAHDPARDFARLGGSASRLVDPHFALRTLSNGALALVAAEIQARGPSTNYVQGELASLMALRAGWLDVREGRADVAVVFACDSLAHPVTWLAYEQAGLLSRRAADRALCPFDVDRDGVVLGEAGAALIIEAESSARARGVPVIAALADVQFSNAGAAGGERVGSALEVLLRRVAGARPRVERRRDEVEASSFIVARGLGTAGHDAVEARALCAAVPAGVPVTAMKGATGYVGAATGLAEAALAIRCLERGVVAPVVHLQTPDSGLPLAFARTAVPLDGPLRVALTIVGGWSGEWGVAKFAR